jgi:surfeit locus 1 family protein
VAHIHMHRLLSPGWLLKHSFALFLVVILIGLGFWQLDRLQQRQAANAARLEAYNANPLTITGNESEPLNERRVRVTGSYLNDESVVLRNERSNTGVNGVHLLTPLRIEGSDQAVLVDRGWIPNEQARPANRPDYTITGTLTLEGIAYPGQTRPDTLLAPYDLPLPGETRIEAWVRVDITKIQEQVSVELLPFYIEQLPAAESEPATDHSAHGGTAAAMPEPRNPTQIDEGPHFGYALQWFTFAGIIIVGYAALMRQELFRR